MSYIKKYSKPKQVSLKETLDNLLAGRNKPHKIGKLHASDLTSETEFCPREFRLLDLTDKERQGMYLSSSLRYTFDYGFALENLVRNKYLTDKVWGTWYCESCGTYRNKNMGPPKGCDLKGVNCRWKYIGERTVSKKHGLTCGIDMVVNLAEPEGMRITEIKTIKNEDFKPLKAPLAEHTLRTALYLYSARQEGWKERYGVNTDYGTVLYLSKGFGYKQADGKMSPFKEFKVLPNEKALEPYLAKAAVLQKARDNKTMPKGICPTSFCQRAKKCSAAAECWGGKYPPTM